MPNLAQSVRGFGRRKPGPWSRVDFTHALARGSIGAWMVNEGGGSLHDLSGNGNSGTLSGSTKPSWAGGRNGLALKFNGSTSYVNFGDVSRRTRITVSAWINTATVAAGQYQILSRDGGNRCWQFRLNGSKLEFIVFIGGSAFTAAGATTLSINKWYHVAGTLDGANAKCFVNGVQDGTIAASGNLDGVSAENVYAGVRNTSLDFFNGYLDEPLIYNRALSAAEVLQLYNEPFAFLQQPGPTRAFFGPGGAVAAPFQFRRTMSGIGARIGTRQTHGWGQ